MLAGGTAPGDMQTPGNPGQVVLDWVQAQTSTGVSPGSAVSEYAVKKNKVHFNELN